MTAGSSGLARQAADSTTAGGRNVRVASVASHGPLVALPALVALVERAAAGSDLVVLPETCRGQSNEAEALPGPTVSALQVVARREHAYIVCPIDRVDADGRWNSVVLIDRRGDIAGVYNKVYPYWEELKLSPPVTPGNSVVVWDTDFGRLGVAVCFDVNFPRVWECLEQQGAELVAWVSAYAGGAILSAYALLHHYYIVTSTLVGESRMYDISGEQVLHERFEDAGISRRVIDFDRAIYHENYNLAPLRRLLAEHEDDVMLERRFEAEQWFVLRARRTGVSARALARAYGLEELRAYVARSKRSLDELRGVANLEALH